MRPPSLFFGLVLLALLAPTALGDFATSRDGVEVQVSPDEHLPAHTPRTVEVDTTPTRLSRPGEAVVKVPAGSAPGAKTALAEGRLLIDGPGSTAVRKGAGAADYVFRGAESAVENRCHMFGHDGGPCRRRDRVQYDTGGSPTRPESPGTATASVWDFAERVADASIREVVVAWPGLPAEARAETSLPEAPGVRRSIELPFLSPLYLAADLPGGVAGAARDVPMPRSGAVSGGPSLPALPRATLVALAAARGVAAAEVAPQLPARVPHEVAGFPLSSGALATAGTGVVADTSFGATVRVLVVVGTGLLLVLVPLLRRILTRSDAEHAARARILTHLSAEPGLSVSEVAARSGLAVSTAAYHLDVLERVGAVVRFRSGKTRRSFVAGQLPAPERARVAVERRPSVARVLSTLREEPGAPLARLASRTGLTAGAVCRILRDLVEGGAVTAAREGRRVHYRAVDPRPGPETGLASPRRQ